MLRQITMFGAGAAGGARARNDARSLRPRPADGATLEPKSAVPTPGSADLCFLVDDFDKVAAHLAAMGVPILEGPVERTGARGMMHS